MLGIVELNELLKSMSPEIQDGEYVFCTFTDINMEYRHLKPLATFKESEGLTLIIPLEIAVKEKLSFEGVFKQITLTVHSSLEAVGLTAAVANKLASYEISANVVAAFYHDHVFVQVAKVQQALSALKEFSN